MIDRFRAAPPARQLILAVGAAAVISGLLAALWFLFLRTSYEPLFTQMRSLDAATIVTELDKRKIPYRLTHGGGTILVPADKVDTTRLAVMSEDLPIKGTVGFELFNKSDMGLTDFAQKINYQRALQGELARTIMTLDGVASARVHLSLGEDRIFRDDRVPPKASVTIRMRDKIVLSGNAAQGVQRLVAAAVPQLDIGNVVILDEQGGVISSTLQPLTTEGATTPFLREKRAIEQYYEARVQKALESYQPGDVTISVQAVISGPAQGGDLTGWTPVARDFALRVTLAFGSLPNPQLRADLQSAAEGAIGLDPALGDGILFTTRQATQEQWAANPPGDSRSFQSPQTLPLSPVETSNRNGWVVPALALLVLLAMFGAVLASRRRSRTLTPRERKAFAARLNAVLETEGDHATSGI